MTLVLAATVLAVAGLMVGSLLTTVIRRVPEGVSPVRPRSQCPHCSSPIAMRDGVPVISWLLLRGRCRSCAARIPIRYPLVELATMVLWLLLGAWASASGQLPLLPLLLALGSAGVALVAIDVDRHRLPNAIVLPLYPVTLVGLLLAGLLSSSWPIVPALVGALAWLLVVGLPWLVSGGRGMGMGDVKLAPILGATLGWVAVASAIVGLVVGFLLGAVVGIALMIAGRAGRRTALAFGPFLLVGALIGLLAGVPLAEAYGELLAT